MLTVYTAEAASDGRVGEARQERGREVVTRHGARRVLEAGRFTISEGEAATAHTVSPKYYLYHLE